MNESLLGLSAQALKETLPSATKVLKPSWGPHGVRGLYALNGTTIDGMDFESTFYFKSNRVERIEQKRVPQDSQCQADYKLLISSLDLQYGKTQQGTGISKNGEPELSVAWTSGTFKVMAYKLSTENRCELLVAFEPFQDKDASEL